MNSNSGESSRRFAFLVASNLLGFGIVTSLLFSHEVSAGEFGFATVAAFGIALLSLILLGSHSRTRLAQPLKHPHKSFYQRVDEPKLSKYLANAPFAAAGIAGLLVLATGLLDFDVELGRSISQDLESVIDWMFPIVCLFAGTLIACNFLAFLSWMIKQDRWHRDPFHKMRLEEQSRYRRKLARERAEASRIAQLNKPDFDTRLNQFVSNVESVVEQQSKNGEPFISQGEFWQCEPVHQRTPPKPLEFIRQILRRISKVVHGA